MARLSRGKRAPTLWALLFASCAIGTGILAAAQPQPAAGDPMRIIPADALFCVRINKLSTALGQVDQFLTGISPFGVSMAVRSQLGQLLGSPELAGIDMPADFAVFGPLPGGEKPDPKRIGILVPLSDFQQFLTNPNVAKPDAQGILGIGPEGQQMMLAVQVGSYALVTGTANRQALVEAKNWTSPPSSLAQRLSPDELKRAQGSPVWVYANIQTLNKMFGPMIQQKIQEGKKKMQEAQAQGQRPMMMGTMGQPEAVLDMYASLLHTLMQETQFVSAALEPTASVIRLGIAATAVPETELAKTLSMDGSQQQPPNLFGYLENGAIMNSVFSLSPALLKAITLKYMDLFAVMMGTAASQEDMAKFKQLMTDSVDALGGTVAWSFSSNLKSKPPVEVKYVATLRDKQKFNQVLDLSAKMMSEGAIANLYKQLGMKMQFDIKRNVETYKDVQIDAIHFAIQPTDANKPEAQMMKTMFGEGFDLRLAIVNNLLLYIMSSEPEKKIHALIDQAKAGGPAQVASEVQAALNLLPDAKKAEIFGTYNILRLMQMGMAFSPMPMPPIDATSQSSIAFTGDIGGGKLAINAAVPKQHVLEIMGAFMKLQQQKMQGMQQNQDQNR